MNKPVIFTNPKTESEFSAIKISLSLIKIFKPFLNTKSWENKRNNIKIN